MPSVTVGEVVNTVGVGDSLCRSLVQVIIAWKGE